MATNSQILLDEIIDREFSDSPQISKIETFFEYFAARNVLRSYDLSDEEIEANLTGSTLDGGCDGIFIFINGELYHEDELIEQLQQDVRITLCIIQAKNENSFGESAFEKWKTTCENLMTLDADSSKYAQRYNEKVLCAFSSFRETYVRLIHKRVKLSIEFKYVSKGSEVHPNVQRQSDELKLQIKKLFPNPMASVDVSFYGADRLMEIIETPAYSDFFLKLAEAPINIEEQQVYVSLVNLSDYYRFITNKDNELIKQIFESNIRDYQGKVAVNKDIQTTLSNPDEEDFWWLNNGVTIIASSAVYNTSKELKITHPEIVNGLQTSNEIYNYFFSHQEALISEKRKILVRVIVPSNEDSRDRIIFATNSQTAIPKASLRTTDGIHRQIELYFRPRQLYYDRRKNYYKNSGKKSSQIVSVSFLAQCLMSIILKKPDYARARPSTLLLDNDAYNKLYLKKQSLPAYYNAAYLGKRVDIALKACPEYSASEKNDILFYVIYCVAATLLRKVNIRIVDLETLDTTKVNDPLIWECADTVNRLYRKLGGNDVVAKGPELIRDVILMLESK